MNVQKDTFDHLLDSPVVSSAASSESDREMARRPESREVQVGDIYPCKGRRKGYWLVVSIRDNGPILGKAAVLLGLDYDYNIVSGATYGLHAMQARELLGWIDLTKATLTN